MKSKKDILERYNELHKEYEDTCNKILSKEYLLNKAYLDWRNMALKEALYHLDWVLDRI